MAGGFTGFPPDAADFFRLLEKNNNREWFLAHKDVYERACREPMKQLMAELEPGSARAKSRASIATCVSPQTGLPTRPTLPPAWAADTSRCPGKGCGSGPACTTGPAMLRRFRAAIDDDAAGRQLATIVSSLVARGTTWTRTKR